MSAYICTIRRRRIFQLNQLGSESLIAAVASVIDNHSSFLRAQILQHPTDSEWDSSSGSEKVRDKSPLCGYCYRVAGVTTLSQHSIVTNVMPLSRPVTQCHEYQPQITQSLNSHRQPFQVFPSLLVIKKILIL